MQEKNEGDCEWNQKWNKWFEYNGWPCKRRKMKIQQQQQQKTMPLDQGRIRKKKLGER